MRGSYSEFDSISMQTTSILAIHLWLEQLFSNVTESRRKGGSLENGDQSRKDVGINARLLIQLPLVGPQESRHLTNRGKILGA